MHLHRVHAGCQSAVPNYPHQSRSLKPPNCTSTSLPFSRVREPKSSLKLHLSPAIPSSLLQTHHRCCCIRLLLTSQPLLILYSLFKESKSCLLCWCCSFSHSQQQQSASPSLKLFFVTLSIVACSLEPNKLILIPSPKVSYDSASRRLHLGSFFYRLLISHSKVSAITLLPNPPRCSFRDNLRTAPPPSSTLPAHVTYNHPRLHCCINADLRYKRASFS